MKPVQKETFYSNLEFLLKVGGIKKTDLEKGAGVSQGYLSRFLQKDDPDALPSVSFIDYCSKVFGVSMDGLINTRLKDMTATEEDIYKFIQKLIEETQNDELIWTQVRYSKIWTNISHTPLREWYGFKKEPRKEGCPDQNGIEEEIVFAPAVDLNGHGILDGSVFYTLIDDDVRIFLLPISCWDDYSHDYINELTLWMENGLDDNGYSDKCECIARGSKDIFTVLLPSLQELQKVIQDRQKHVQVDKDFRNIICSYINPKPSDINQKISEPQISIDDILLMDL